MRITGQLLLVLLVLRAPAQGAAGDERDQKSNQIYRLTRDTSAEATTALKRHLQDDDFRVALLAALALAARGDAHGLALLESTAKKGAGELRGFFGLAIIDDPRCEAIMAIEKLAPRKALGLYIDYLDNLGGIHQRLCHRRWSGSPPAFCLELAVSRAYELAEKEGKKPWLIGRFAERFEANPKDSDAAHILARLLDADGQKREARDVRLAEIRNTAQSALEATMRTLDLRRGRLRYGTGPRYRQTVARVLKSYRGLLKLDAAQVQALRRRHGAKPFLREWRLGSVASFREIVKFRVADCLLPKEALEVYKEIFASNPKAQYGGCLVSILNRVFREMDHARTVEQRRTSYRKTVKMYAEALAKSPEDRQLKALYLKALLAAHMADRAKGLMTEMLQSPDWRVRAEPTYCLRSYYRLEEDNAAQEAIAMLARALTDEHPHVRKRAAHELGQLYKPPEQAAIALLKAIRDPDHEVREEAIQSLRNIGWNLTKRRPRAAGRVNRR